MKCSCGFTKSLKHRSIETGLLLQKLGGELVLEGLIYAWNWNKHRYRKNWLDRDNRCDDRKIDNFCSRRRIWIINDMLVNVVLGVGIRKFEEF